MGELASLELPKKAKVLLIAVSHSWSPSFGKSTTPVVGYKGTRVVGTQFVSFTLTKFVNSIKPAIIAIGQLARNIHLNNHSKLDGSTR
jgi:hypothetical protein